MQVAQVNDSITHAVIGANAARSFGISDSPEFFNILSSTLYSNKPVALARETLCNAWDAHIASKRTHLPIEITFNNNELVIRDRGTGIPKALMHQVYCVYGASTKVENDDENGGFGLGCKVPFIYVDHFEVTSFNSGMKTIYRISKSSGEVKGKPGMMEIVSIPTDETGLEVRIELNNSHEVSQIRAAIERVVLNGEMKAKLNGRLLPTLPFSTATEGYLLTKEKVDGHSNHRIFVRYGTVIYPIAEHEDYRANFRLIHDFLKKLPGGGNYSPEPWYLILQAKPRTIGITPSRESLSMTETTVNTLAGLIRDFLQAYNRRHRVEATEVNQECVKKAFADLRPTSLLDPKKAIVGLGTNSFLNQALVDFGQVSRAVLASHYPNDPDFRRSDIELRLRSLIEFNYGNRGKIQTFLAEFLNKKSVLESGDWFQRRLVAPLLTGISQEDHLSPERLLVYGRNEANDEDSRRRRNAYSSTENHFIEAKKFKKAELTSYLPYLRNIVLLSNNRKDVEERACHFPEMQHWFGTPFESLVYVVHRSETKINAARAFFEKQGFWVVDLTKRYKGEPEPVVEVFERVREYRPRKVGLPILSSLMRPGDRWISTTRFKEDGVARLEAPEFVVKIGSVNENDHFERFDSTQSADIVRLFGSKGAVVVSDSQAQKYLDAGAKRLEAWLFDKVLAEIKSNKRILDHQAVEYERITHTYRHETDRIMRVILGDTVLSTYYNVLSPLTEDDRAYLRLWQHLARVYYHSGNEVRTVTKLLSDVALDPNLKKLADKVTSSPFRGAINIADLDRILAKDETSPSINMQKAKARDLLIFAIAG